MSFASEADVLEHDSVAGARQIAALPFDDESNNSAATTGPEDQRSACAADATHSVWYQFTPSQDERLYVDVDANFYPVLELFEGPELDSVACTFGQFSYRTSMDVELSAGTTYLLRLASPYGFGDWYALHAERFVPLEVSVEVADRARLTSGGRAEVPVTVRCSKPAYVDLDIESRQALGPAAVIGYGYEGFRCTGQHDLLVRVDPQQGAYLPGRLDSSWYVYACGDDDRFSWECVYPTGGRESLILPL